MGIQTSPKTVLTTAIDNGLMFGLVRFSANPAR